MARSESRRDFERNWSAQDLAKGRAQAVVDLRRDRQRLFQLFGRRRHALHNGRRRRGEREPRIDRRYRYLNRQRALADADRHLLQEWMGRRAAKHADRRWRPAVRARREWRLGLFESRRWQEGLDEEPLHG